MTIRLRAGLLVMLSALLVLSVATLLWYFPGAKPASAHAPEEQAAMAENPEELFRPAPEELYLLKENNGRIAVYRAPDYDVPEQVTNIMTVTLRRYDQLNLQTGIMVQGWENLQKALEDFGP